MTKHEDPRYASMDEAELEQELQAQKAQEESTLSEHASFSSQMTKGIVMSAIGLFCLDAGIIWGSWTISIGIVTEEQGGDGGALIAIGIILIVVLILAAGVLMGFGIPKLIRGAKGRNRSNIAYHNQVYQIQCLEKRIAEKQGTHE